MEGPGPLLTEFGIHQRLESYVRHFRMFLQFHLLQFYSSSPLKCVDDFKMVVLFYPCTLFTILSLENRCLKTTQPHLD